MKKWYQSKTIIIALLQAVLGVIIAVQTEYPEIAGLMFVKSLIDVTIRTVTSTKVR